MGEFWATPSFDPATPPPHSTGAAIDVTLTDENGRAVDMGSPIDELSDRSFPDHFAGSNDPEAQQCDRHRTLLLNAMRSAGFQRHPKEWWHFSCGDQLHTWLVREEKVREEKGNCRAIARYGCCV